jgi:hypothetical protein
MLQRRPGALALPVAREDVSSPLHFIENPNGADKSVPERVGLLSWVMEFLVHPTRVQS